MESNEITKGAIMITYLSCIRILGGVMEVLLLQPGTLLLRLRDVDALNLKDDRPRTVIATGDHHTVVVGPPLHDGPSLQGGYLALVFHLKMRFGMQR